MKIIVMGKPARPLAILPGVLVGKLPVRARSWCNVRRAAAARLRFRGHFPPVPRGKVAQPIPDPTYYRNHSFGVIWRKNGPFLWSVKELIRLSVWVGFSFCPLTRLAFLIDIELTATLAPTDHGD